MEIRPILSTLGRHRIAAGLIVVEIAITFAIVCNAIFLIAARVERANVVTGFVEPELVTMQVLAVGARAKANKEAQTRLDLATLRALDGVRGVTLTNQIPFGDSSSNTSVALPPDMKRTIISPWITAASENFIATTGVRLIAGRDFTPGEYVDALELYKKTPPAAVPAVIIDRAMAERLYPAGNAVGSPIGVYDAQSTVVGVVERLSPPVPFAKEPYTIVLPLRVDYDGSMFVLRVDPTRRDEVLAAALKAIDTVGPGRIAKGQRYDELRGAFFAKDRTMALLLAGVCAVLLVVTAFGIVGLASFWVQQRVRMIGTRRALGATRAQVMRYFQLENLLLTAIGVLIGIVAAYAINELLVGHYQVARLPASYLPVGAALLLLLGQAAVFGPARRAAALPPVAVMRGA